MTWNVMKTGARYSAAFVAALTACAALAPTNIARAAENDAFAVTSRNDIATATEIQNATPIQPKLIGISKNEPNVCLDDNGTPINAPRTFTTGATFPEGPADRTIISPSSYVVSNLLPGTTYQGCISVQTSSPTPVRMRFDDVDLTASEDGSTIDLVDQSTGVGTWVTPSERSFTVKAGERRAIPYIITTPDALPGGTVVGGVRIVVSPRGGVQATISQRIYISSPGGTRKAPSFTGVESTRFISRTPGHKAYVLRMKIRNDSDYLLSYASTVELNGFGKTVRKVKGPSNTLLPDGNAEFTQRMTDVPWIGLYRPKLVLKTNDGDVVKELPLVIVLPPTIYLIATIAALFLPITYLIVRWRRRRAEWMAYLIAEMEAEERGEGSDVDEDFWDPATS